MHFPRALLLLSAFLVLPGLGQAQLILSIGSNPARVCPAANAEVGLVALTNTTSAMQTIPAGMVMTFTFDAPIVGAPSVTGGASPSVSFSGSTLTLTFGSSFQVTPGGGVGLSGTRLNLTGASGSVFIYAGFGIWAAGVNSTEVARVTPLTFTPSGVSFNTELGGGNPASQTVTVNIFFLQLASTASWLTAVLNGSTITVSAAAAGMAAGTYTGMINVADLSGNSCGSVPVNLNVAAPLLSLTNSSLTFTGSAGGTLASQPLGIRSSTGFTVAWSAAVSSQSGGNWLSISPASGNTDATPNVSVNTTGLPLGTYRGTITVTSALASNSPQTVNVTLTLTQPPTIQLASTALTFSAQQGSANPPAQTVALTNTGGGTLSYTATASTTSGGNWLSVTPASGAAPATLSVGVNLTGLAAGSYNGSVQVAASGATNTPRTLTVSLTVTPAGNSIIALDPGAMQFVSNVGASPSTQTFQIQNRGTAALGWTAAAGTASGGNWLAVSPTTGVAPSTLTLTINANGLATGLYSGTITITALASANATNSPQTVAVTLAVGVPVVGQGGIVNGASFAREAVVSASGITSLFGTNLAGGTEAASRLPLPTTLANTQVLVNERAAPLFYVSPLQINFQMPAEASGTTVPVVVVSGGIRGLSTTATLAPEVPGIFSAQPGGTGQGAVLNQDSSANSADNPAARDSVIQIFATGLGATNPRLDTGQPGATSPPFNETVQKPVVMIGGLPAEVLFSAIAPGFVGLYQVNARVPTAVPAGSAVTLQIQVGSRSSNTVTIAIR